MLKLGVVRGFALSVAVVVVASGAAGLAASAAGAFSLAKWEAGTCKVSSCEDSGPASQFYTQAAGHPNVGITDFSFSTIKHTGLHSYEEPEGHVKDVRVDLPPGLAVDPEATKALCTPEELQSDKKECPSASQVGVDEAVGTATVIGDYKETVKEPFPVYNMVRLPGEPSRFGVEVNSEKLELIDKLLGLHLQGFIYLEGGISWQKEPVTAENSGVETGNYHEYFKIDNIPQEPEVIESRLVFWGVPQDEQTAPTEPPTGFITLPSTCSEKPVTYLHVNAYEEEGHWLSAANQTPVTATGCDSLAFQPSLGLTPETTQSDAPDGASTTLHVPQYMADPTRPDSPDVQEAKVTLPEGMTLNPAAANGLEACSSSGYEAASCPPGSQIGTLGVNAPGIPDGSITGGVYVGAPESGASPSSGGEYRIFLIGESAQYGVGVRLEGRVSANESNGQLTATFASAPQVPVEDLTIHFNGGNRAPLANPLACGAATPAAAVTPYGGEPAAAAGVSGFTVDANGAGEGCPPSPSFSLSQSLAPVSPANAGEYDPATFALTRAQGQQYLSKISTTLPAGLLGAIPSVKLCGEAEANAGTCSAESEIGTVKVTAGAGAEPYTFTGKAYLTGPYEGAPYGMSVVVPAVAGPYDLGTVVTRATLNVGIYDGRVTVAATLPSIVGGVPLRLQSLDVDVSRSHFLFNPTSCGEQHTESTLTALGGGATQGLSTPFQVGNCGALAFKPVFAASSKAKPTKPNGASIVVKITQPGGQANLHYVQMQLPKQLVARLSTLQKACLASAFEKGPPPGECKSTSQVGTVSVTTPVLPGALTGDAYFVSYGAEAFPDLDLVLHGDGVEVVLKGKTHIAHSSITTSTFEEVPDVPISSVTVDLPVGPSSALAANGRLCDAGLAAPTTLIAQSGAKITQNTSISVSGCAIQLISHRLRGRRVSATVWVPEAGRLTITGKGVKRKTVRAKKAGRVRFMVPVTAAGMHTLYSGGRRRRRALKLRVGFSPHRGHNTSAVRLSQRR